MYAEGDVEVANQDKGTAALLKERLPQILSHLTCKRGQQIGDDLTKAEDELRTLDLTLVRYVF